MDTHFNLKRFYNYLKYDINIHLKTYLIVCSVLFVGCTVYNYISLSARHRFYNYEFTFLAPLFISGIIIISTSFPELKEVKRTIYYLLIPASTLEKFLVQFLIRIVAFISFYFLSFWLSLKLANVFYLNTDFKKHYILDDFGVFSYFDKIGHLQDLNSSLGLYLIIAITLFVFTGATVFKKFAPAKTLLAFSIVILSIYLILLIYSHLFIDSQGLNWFVPNIRTRSIGKYNTDSGLILTATICCITSIIALPLAFYKLKEKQI